LGADRREAIVAMIAISEARPGKFFVLDSGCRIQLDVIAKKATFHVTNKKMFDWALLGLKTGVESGGYTVIIEQ